ncbi:TIGR04372 family glycosyltransferase [Bacteroidota bacterium]
MKNALNNFITRQINQMSTGGWPVLWSKLMRMLFLLIKLPFILLSFLIVLLIRLFSPLIVIRLGTVDVGRIGGIYPGEWYLTEKAAGLHKGRYIDFFYFNKSTNHVNQQWEKMWKQALPYLPGNEIWKNMLTLNRLFPGSQKHEILKSKRIFTNDMFLNAVLKNRSPNISFTVKEEEKGIKALDKIGIPRGKPYICFHNRDSSFLDDAYIKLNWSYHNYRDSHIKNYVPAAEEMAKLGYFAIRMGAIVKDPIQSSNPQLIDYATSNKRTDFNDVYIGSHCRFFLCSNVGISVIPEMLRIPVIYVNWTRMVLLTIGPHPYLWASPSLFIFKKFYLKKDNRYMSFSEILNLKFGGKDTYEIFARLNLVLIENTAEEIIAVTIEMEQRLNDSWQNTEEDEELQKRFWALFDPDKHKNPAWRIGTEFLRQNRELLK